MQKKQSRVSKIPLLAASKCHETERFRAKEARNPGRLKYSGKKWELFMIARMIAATKKAKGLL